jgi:hypothetical protein
MTVGFDQRQRPLSLYNRYNRTGTCVSLPPSPPFCPSLIPQTPHPRISRNVYKTAGVGLAWAKTPQKCPPPMPEPPPPPPNNAFFLSDLVEGRRNSPHVAMYSRMKCRLGGRDVVPTGVWLTLALRGVSQPTPNAPEARAPRAIGMCLNIASGHVRRYFYISEVLDIQFPPIFAI